MIGPLRGELPVQHIAGDRLLVLAHRRPLEALPHAATQAIEPHQAHDALAADGFALRDQVLLDP